MEENEALSDVTAVEGKKTNRPVVLATIMMAMFIGAIEANIVATAMPSIVADLGGVLNNYLPRKLEHLDTK